MAALSQLYGLIKPHLTDMPFAAGAAPLTYESFSSNARPPNATQTRIKQVTTKPVGSRLYKQTGHFSSFSTLLTMSTLQMAFGNSVRDGKSPYMVSCPPQVPKFPLIGTLERAFKITNENCGNVGIEEVCPAEPYSYILR